MRLTGKLTVWDAQGRFGVVTPDDGSDEIFVESSDGLQDPPPLLGELLMFDVAKNRDGTRRAMNIARLSRANDGLSLAPVDTSLQARAAAQAKPYYRATPVRPPRRVRTPWSLGRIVITVIVIAGAAWLLLSQRETLRAVPMEGLPSTKLLPTFPEAPVAAPRERLTH